MNTTLQFCPSGLDVLVLVTLTLCWMAMFGLPTINSAVIPSSKIRIALLVIAASVPTALIMWFAGITLTGVCNNDGSTLKTNFNQTRAQNQIYSSIGNAASKGVDRVEASIRHLREARHQ